MVKTIRELKKEKKKLIAQFKKMNNEEIKLRNDLEMVKVGAKRMTASKKKANTRKLSLLRGQTKTIRDKIWRIQKTIDAR